MGHRYLLVVQGRKWFDCAECHVEQEDHPLLQQLDMVNAPMLFKRGQTVLIRVKTDICLQEV